MLKRIRDGKRLKAVLGFLCNLLIFVIFPPFLIAICIRISHYSTDGEPFSLTEGISIWPTLLLLGVAAVFAARYSFGVTFIPKWILKKDRLSDALLRLADPSLIDSSLDPPNLRESLKHFGRIPLHQWKTIEDEEQVPAIRDLMKEFCWKSSSWPQILRAGFFTAILIAYGSLIWSLTGTVSIGVRGFWLGKFFFLLTTSAYVFFFFLATIVIDSIQLVRLLTKRLGKGTTNWPVNLPEVFPDSKTYRHHTEAAAVKSIQVIAEGTERVSRKIWALGLVCFLLFAAHYSFFEYFAIPRSMILILSPIVVGVIISMVMMRLEADKARTQILNRLQFRRLARNPRSTTFSDEATKAIANENRGAFRPLSRDPLVQVLSIPFGGTTGLLLLEQALRVISN